MRKYDLLIRGGKIVNAAGVFSKDAGIKEGKIVAIEDYLDGCGEQAVDAEGKYLFPGGIDVHTHMDLSVGDAVSSDDLATLKNCRHLARLNPDIIRKTGLHWRSGRQPEEQSPGKGNIAIGSDADVVIFDPNREIVLTKVLLHENVDYTPYEG